MISAPLPEDAGEWFDFLVAQQVIAYAGIVPADFGQRQLSRRDVWVPELADNFKAPGTARRVVARHGGRIVGVASVVDAPQDWEVSLGLVPAPCARQLDRLYLAPAFQGRGLGTEMLTRVDDGQDLYLWLVSGNAPAHQFYLRRDFVDLAESHPAGSSWGEVAMHRMVRRH